MRARRVTFAALTTFGAAVGLVPAAAHADPTPTIYVDSSNPNCVGYATGSGTQADPYCELQWVSSPSPGTTVLVAPGKGYSSGLYLSASPDPTRAPIVITGVGGHVQVHAGFQFQNVDNVTVQGFDFTNGAVSAMVGGQGISVLHNTFTATGPINGAAIGAATTVVGNTITGPYANGITVNGGFMDRSGSYTTPNLVDGNDVSGIAAGGDGIGVYGADVQVSGNRVHGDDGVGIASHANFSGYGAVQIVDNMIWANGGAGISVTAGITEYLTSNTIVGNNGPQVSVSTDSPLPVFVRNNIIAGHDGSMTSYSGPTATAPLAGIQTDTKSWQNAVIESNIVDVPGGTPYANGYAAYADAAALQKVGKGAHEINADPGLNTDGTLKAGSPAIDSADSGADGEQTVDIDNAPRVDTPSITDAGMGIRSYDDRGAEEFGSTAPGTRPPAPTAPVLPHTDCGVAAVPSNPAVGNPNQPSLASTDLPPLGSDGHNLYQGTPGVVHAHSSGGTGGVVCYKFAVDNNVSETGDTTVVPADADGNADLIVHGNSFGSQYVSVVAIDKAGRQSPQGTYMFYSVGGGTPYWVMLSTAAVPGQPLAADVTGQLRNVIAAPLPPGYSYQFSFGDGSEPVTQTGTTVRHVFPKAATYAVEARLLDDTGAIVTEEARYVSVPLPAAAPPPPSGGGTTPPPPGGGTGTPPPATGVFVDRIYGLDRFGTGVNVSTTQWRAGQAEAVVLARGGTFPDALSGVPLAAHRHGPLLLTETISLNPAVAGEIRRVLGPDTSKTVYILGGAGAVSPEVEKNVRALGYQVVRYGGADRFATALQVAQSFGPTKHVVVATGQNFPDALSAGPLGAVEDAPIVLSQDRDLDPATAAFVKSHAAVETVGGQADVAVRTHVGVTGKTYLALWGDDRYLTSKAVAQAVVTALGHAPTGAGLASGMNFPDALTGGAYAANAAEPLLLTDPAQLPAPIGDELAALAAHLRSITIFGGPNAVSPAVKGQVLARVGGH